MSRPAWTLASALALGLALGACKSAPPKPVKKPVVAAVSPAEAKKAQAYYLEGVYAYADGATEKAMAAWKKALALDPKHAPTLKAMAEAKAKLKAIKNLKD